MTEKEIDAMFAETTEKIHRKTIKLLQSGVDFYRAITTVIKEEADSVSNAFVRKKITEQRGFIIHNLGMQIIREHPLLIF